jgi:hypothetical protein
VEGKWNAWQHSDSKNNAFGIEKKHFTFKSALSQAVFQFTNIFAIRKRRICGITSKDCGLITHQNSH